MDWNSIKYFLAIEDKGNVKQAAQSLGISASTLFRQLNTLEETHGRLFERLAGRYVLTEQGQALLRLAKSAEESFHEIERKTAGKEEALSGRVRLTAPMSFSYGALMEIIEALNRDYPDISIDLIVDNELVNLVAYQADIALRVAPSPPEQLIAKKLGEFSWGLYANAQLIDCSKVASLESLRTHKIIGASGPLSERIPYRWLASKFDRLSYRVNDLFAMRSLALKGCGLALLPVEFETAQLTRVFDVSDLADNKLWLLIHPDLRGVKRVRVVTEAIETYFREHQTGQVVF